MLQEGGPHGDTVCMRAQRAPWLGCCCAGLLLAGCADEAAAPPPPVIAAASAPAREPRTPREVQNSILRWFAGAGYKRFQAEAMADHASIESGFNQCAGGHERHYTYQWGGERLQRLEQ